MGIPASATVDTDERLRREPSAQIIDRTPDHVLASWRDILLVVWRRQTTLGAVHTMGVSLGVLARRVGHPVDLVIVAEQTAAAPDADVRRPIAQVLKAAPIARCAVVLEGDGFRAAALRAFATGVGMLACPPFPYRPFAHVVDAASWLATCGSSHTPPLWAESIERAVRYARAG
jgi:hypothetical protein